MARMLYSWGLKGQKVEGEKNRVKGGQGSYEAE